MVARVPVKRIALLAGLLAVAACQAATEVKVTVPYCPVDSLHWVAQDSVPLGCIKPFAR